MIRCMIVGLIVGGCIGWGLRTSSTSDRYVISHAKRLESEKRYFDAKLDQMIEDNIVKYGRPLKVENKGEQHVKQ